MEKFLDYDEAEGYIEKNQLLYEEEEEKEEDEDEMKVPAVWFYAVAVGRSTGVYMNHQEAMEQVHGYSGFRMKKFRDFGEAEEYIAFNQVYSSDEEDESEAEAEVEEEIWYYAVAVGRTTGVYTDWQEAMEQVRGYSGFRMKKFLDYSEAQQYIGENRLYYEEDEEEKSDDEEEVEQEEVWYYAVAVGRRIGVYTNRGDALTRCMNTQDFG